MTRSRTSLVVVVYAVMAWVALGQEATTVEPKEKPYSSSAALNLTREQEAQLKRVTRKVLCACKTCPPTLLDDCLCGTARELKDRLKARLLEGASPEVMLSEYLAENGSEYLAAPPKEGFNWVLWVFPSVAFVGLGAVFWVVLQRFTRRSVVVAAKATPHLPSASVERYREEIERQVSERGV